MDKDELIKTLSDSKTIRKMFFENLKSANIYNASQSQAALTGESPEFAEYLNKLNIIFPENPDPKQVLNFVLLLNLVMVKTIDDYNQLLMNIVSDKT